jgi:hypothetical protein
MGSAHHAMDSANPNVPIMNTHVRHPDTGKEMQYKDLMKNPTLGLQYKKGLCNESGRLCQEIRDIQVTSTCFFVELTNIPKDHKIKYGKLVCDYKQKKTEKMGQANICRRQTGLYQRRGNFYCRHYNFQNPYQQRAINKGCRDDDDGYKELLFGNNFTQI